MTIRSAIAGLLATIAIPCMVHAGATVPGFYGTVKSLLPVSATQLPVLKPGGTLSGASTPVVSGNQMTINQTQSQAIIDWSQFNIGSAATVYFNQQGNTSWAALNRIWDANPSQIYGTLSASGKIYLINQNGILFGPGSTVNVHTLVASSLNIQDQDFLSGTLHFVADDYNGQGTNNMFYSSLLSGSVPGTVSNAGTITTDVGGSVFLIGPQVENSGSITTPSGQIGLVAGTDVMLELPVDANGNNLNYPSGNLALSGYSEDARSAMVVVVNSTSGANTATNLQGGLLSADTGLVGMYGNIVNQDGLIRSVTAVQQASHVELFASNQITTGPGSLIWLPVDASSTAFDPAMNTAQSTVVLSGIDLNSPYNPKVYPSLIMHEGSIVAPSGLVTMNAVNRVYLASDSLIDVSGLWLSESASAGLLTTQLTTYSLRDNFSQKGGVLQDATISMNQLSGSAIGDVSASYTGQSLTAQERHTIGGEIDMAATGSGSSGGSVVEMQGATINFSGGGIVYGAGAVDTTVLVSGTNLYGIASAPTNVTYDAVLNGQSFTNGRFGITDTYDGVYYGGAFPVSKYSPSYTVGANAGLLDLQASTVVLDGAVYGKATNGLQQTLSSNPMNSTGYQSESGYAEAEGGTLDIGGGETVDQLYTDRTNADGVSDFVVQSIAVSAQTSPVLAPTFGPVDPLTSSTTVLSAAMLTNAGLSKLNLAANTTISIQKGAQIAVNPGGSLSATARQIMDYGGISAPGGKISLSLKTNITSNPIPDGSGNPTNPYYVPLNEIIFLGNSSSLIASGQRINDTTAAVSTTGLATSGYLNGGSISIQDQTVTGQGVFMIPGAVIDVSGGWEIGSSGSVSGGNAGNVTFQAPSLVLDGTLQGLSLAGSKGGSISLTAPNITIAASPGSLPSGFTPDSSLPQSLVGQLILGANQLDGSGFTNITLNSVNDIALQNGTLGPSRAKLATPAATVSQISTNPGIIFVTQDQVGASSIAMTADASASVSAGLSNLNGNGLLSPAVQNGSAKISIGQEASVTTAPQGSINMTAPVIDIAGLLSAPAGTITLLSQQSSTSVASGTLTLETSARLLADGYNQPVIASGTNVLSASETPLSGGSITLTAGNILNLSSGAVISVAAASPVQEPITGDNGSLSFVTNAGVPGSISLSATTINGLSGPQAATLNGQARHSGHAGWNS